MTSALKVYSQSVDVLWSMRVAECGSGFKAHATETRPFLLGLDAWERSCMFQTWLVPILERSVLSSCDNDMTPSRSVRCSTGPSALCGYQPGIRWSAAVPLSLVLLQARPCHPSSSETCPGAASYGARRSGHWWSPIPCLVGRG